MNPKDNKVKSLYTACIVLLPILSVYASGIPGFTAGDLVLILFFVYWIISALRGNGSLTIHRHTLPLVPLILAIPLASLLSILLQSNVAIGDVVIRIVRRLFYYVCVILLSSKWFDFTKAKDLMVKVGKLGTVYLAIQYVAFYVFDRVLVGFLPFLPVYHENYSEIDYGSIFEKMFRPTSFLLEPAHFSRYLLLALCIILFSDSRYNRKSYLWAALFTIAIVATTSGLGIIIAAAVWICWIIRLLTETVHTRKLSLIGAVCLALIPLAVVAIFNSEVFQTAFERIADSDLADANTAGGARFRGFVQYFKLPVLFQIIGMGYGSTPNTSLVTWFSGASYILYGTGLIGMCACVYLFGRLFFDSRSGLKRVLTIVLIFLFAMDDSFMSHVAVVYLSFICFAESKENMMTPKRNENIQ